MKINKDLLPFDITSSYSNSTKQCYSTSYANAQWNSEDIFKAKPFQVFSDANSMTKSGCWMINYYNIKNMPTSNTPGVMIVCEGKYTVTGVSYVAQIWICTIGAWSRFRDTSDDSWKPWSRLSNAS